jgi:hypothetical protein
MACKSLIRYCNSDKFAGRYCVTSFRECALLSLKVGFVCVTFMQVGVW